MTESNNASLAAYSNRRTAMDAVRTLRRSGYSMERVTVVGRDHDKTSRALAEVRVGNQSWTGIFALPGLGPTIVSGPLAENFAGPLAGMLARSDAGAGERALARGLTRLGVASRDAREASNRIRRGEFVVVVSGGRRELRAATSLLASRSTTNELRAPAYRPLR